MQKRSSRCINIVYATLFCGNPSFHSRYCTSTLHIALSSCATYWHSEVGPGTLPSTSHIMGRAAALAFLLASAKAGQSFLLTGPRIASAWRQRRCQHEHVASNDLPGTCRSLMGPLTVASMTAADASTQQQQLQQQQLPLAAELLNVEEGDSSEGLSDATSKPAAPEHLSLIHI